MKPISKVIEESTATARRLMQENPGLEMMSFIFNDFPVDDVRAAGAELKSCAEFDSHFNRVLFCYSPITGLYIHIRSVEVKAKVVYEETQNA